MESRIHVPLKKTGIQHPESTIHEMGSRIQDCLLFLNMGVKVLDCERRVTVSGPAEQFSKYGGRSTSFEVKLWGGGGGGGGGAAVVGLWNLKMVYLVSTQYFFNTVTTHQSHFAQISRRRAGKHTVCKTSAL